MKQERKFNTAAMFKNDDERENYPDYSGEANVDGTLYYIDSWINESKAGLKYLSIKFKKKPVGNHKSEEIDADYRGKNYDDASVPF